MKLEEISIMNYRQFEKEYENRHEDLAKWRMVDQALWSYGHCFHVRSI